MFELNETLLNYFYYPQHVGSFKANDRTIGTGVVGDDACIMQLQIRVDTDVVIETKFKTHGCVSAIATMSWLSDHVLNKALNELAAINSEFIIEQLQLSPRKYYCALLAEDALKAAIGNFQQQTV